MAAGWAGRADAAPSAQGDPAAPGMTYRLVDTWRKAPWTLTAGRFGETADISSGPDGTVYVLDVRYNVVHVLDAEGRPRGLFGVPQSTGTGEYWSPLRLDVGFDGQVHVLVRGPFLRGGVFPHRVERYAPDGRLVDFFDLPMRGDVTVMYHDVGVRLDGRVYVSRTGPDNPFIVWPGPPPTPLPPGAVPPDGVDVFARDGKPQAVVATSCMPDSLDLDRDGTLYVVNRCPAAFSEPPPPGNPDPEPSGRRPGVARAEAPTLDMPKQEGVAVFASDHAFRDLVPFNNPEDVAVGPAGAFVSRHAEIFALREGRPLYVGPTGGQHSAFFGRVVFRLDVPADGRLLASMNHCYFQGLLAFARPADRPATPRLAGALDNPELEGPPHPLRVAAGDDVAVLQGRYTRLGVRPNHEHVVMPFGAEAQTVQRYDRYGGPTAAVPLRSQLGVCGDSETRFTRDVAIDGRTVYTADPDQVQQRPDDGLPAWTFAPAVLAGLDETPFLQAVSAGGGRVALLDIGRQKVVVLDAAGTVLHDWPIATGDANGVPVDLALHGDRVFLADQGRNRIVVRGLDGADLGAFPTHDGPLAVAAGPTGDVFVLGRGGWGFRYRPDGTPVAAWAMPDRAIDALDLAVDGRGYVYVNHVRRDPYPQVGGSRRGLPEYTLAQAGVWVFAPAEAGLPPAAGACVAVPDKRARPARIPLGATVDVALDVDGLCPGTFAPAQVIIAFDTSRSMTFDGALERAQSALTAVLGGVDNRAVEVGLVTFDAGATLAAPLTRDLSDIRARILALAADGDTRMAAGIDLAVRELTGPRGDAAARRVVLVVSDGAFKDEPADAAARARQAGIDLYGLVFSTQESSDLAVVNLQAMAGDPGRVLVDPSVVDLDRFVATLGRDLAQAGLFQSITIDDVIPANMRYVAGSARPAAAFDPARNVLTWTLYDVPAAGGVRLTYTLLPLECGSWPTNVEATARFRDALGHSGRLVFPVPEVDVYCGVHRIYLPFAVAGGCVRPERALDVVLVMDTSSSMREPAPDGTRTKLDAARAAADAFVDLLRLPSDHVGVVAFNRAAARAVELTGDADRVRAGLRGLASAEGTRIDLGLAAAVDLVAAGRRPGALPVVVLLTDGLQNTDQAPNGAVLAQAAALKAAGARVYTIGLGGDIDRDLLRAVATSADRYRESPTADDLARIYAEISERLACEGGG
ncbi:hypothetical protein DCC79_11420 [bacterium]|nr:MAG: hypothetical protein DCC79_11420 [bacterium]